jgi:hypothetical protein
MQREGGLAEPVRAKRGPMTGSGGQVAEICPSLQRKILAGLEPTTRAECNLA